jgi:3-oxoacyl-[acyl-carrier protein] reductase
VVGRSRERGPRRPGSLIGAVELQGRVALVTGGGTGLGRSISLAFAAEGVDLSVGYSRSAGEAEQTVQDVRARGVRAKALRADVADSSEARRLLQDTLQTFGRLDILVNNAATTVMAPLDDLEAVSDEEWDRIMAVNVRAPWVLARAAAGALSEQSGCIVNVASIAGLRPAGSSLAYCVSKAGLIHLTRCLAVAMAPDVRVNAVAPGFMRTRWGSSFGDEALAEIAASSPLQRLVPTEDAATAAVMLARNESMTGQILVVDAGILQT